MSADTDANRAPNPDHAWKTLSLINEWIRHGDAKLGLTLAANGVLAAVLYNLVEWSEFGRGEKVLSVVAGLAILTTALCAVAGVLPQLKNPGKKEGYTSLLYYRHIARGWTGRRERYQHKLIEMTMDANGLATQLAHQVYWNAGIADRKFVWATRAISSLAVAMVATGLLAAARLLSV